MPHRLDLIKILNQWRGTILNKEGDEDQALKAETILAIALRAAHPRWPRRRCYQKARAMMENSQRHAVHNKEGRR